MNFYVYIIESEVDGTFYKGFSENPILRLAQHNLKESKYTSSKIPWKLIHIEIYDSKRDALIREKVIKKYSREQVNQLILSGKNKLKEFLSR